MMEGYEKQSQPMASQCVHEDIKERVADAKLNDSHFFSQKIHQAYKYFSSLSQTIRKKIHSPKAATKLDTHCIDQVNNKPNRPSTSQSVDWNNYSGRISSKEPVKCSVEQDNDIYYKCPPTDTNCKNVKNPATTVKQKYSEYFECYPKVSQSNCKTIQLHRTTESAGKGLEKGVTKSQNDKLYNNHLAKSQSIFENNTSLDTFIYHNNHAESSLHHRHDKQSSERSGSVDASDKSYAFKFTQPKSAFENIKSTAAVDSRQNHLIQQRNFRYHDPTESQPCHKNRLVQQMADLSLKSCPMLSSTKSVKSNIPAAEPNTRLVQQMNGQLIKHSPIKLQSDCEIVKGHISAGKYEDTLEKQGNEYLNNKFRNISIFPCMNDLNRTPLVFRPNVILGSYKDVDHYLDIQFRLLREDFIRPLREGILTYRYSKLTKREATFKDINVYKNVSIMEKTFNKQGEEVIEISFGSEQFRQLDWSQNKRFMNGTLLCLSYDDFDSFFLASVDEKDCQKLQEGRLVLKLEGVAASVLNPSLNFIMIETNAFFGAYRYNLHILQRLHTYDFPMKKYIVHVQKRIDAPAYLTCNTAYDFKTLLKKSKKAMVPILNFNSWPSKEQLDMNAAQYEAIKSAVTKEFALVQGPPGTGKSFIGLKIVKLLVNNSDVVNLGPILILCYTNHALDQFLEGISKFTDKIVRIGGGCENENLERFLLREIRYQFCRNPYKGYDVKIFREQKKILQQFQTRRNNIHENIHLSSKEILECKHLLEYMEPMHAQSLISMVHMKKQTDCIHHWLEITLTGNKNKKPSHSGLNRGNINVEWIMVGSKKIPRNELECDAMSEREAASVANIQRLCLKDRWRLYNYWVKQRVVHLRSKLSKLQHPLYVENKKFLKIREELDLHILSNCKIIGMTITGAAKHHNLLEDIGPRVVVIEEAAEVLESHVVTSLTSTTQHVILIGDHQQLRPKPNVYELSIKFKTDVSLFERMVNNQVDYRQLTIQHRMRPSISSLLVPHIYPNLVDHESVMNFKDIKGVKNNVFFLTHNESESDVSDSRSKTNMHEASFVVKLCIYFMQQGYDDTQITILTTYREQKYVIEDLMTNHICHSVQVRVVDNYQGEENDIILISFVRSNNEGKIGFLVTPNRVCVALSRARKGLFCIGDFELYAKKSSLWKRIVNSLKKSNNLGTSLLLYCQTHPQTITEVSNADDFKFVPDGGCMYPCKFRLLCGHFCVNKCHSWNKSHTEYKCKKKCNRRLCKNNHKCPKKCHEKCDPCCKMLSGKVMPDYCLNDSFD